MRLKNLIEAQQLTPELISMLFRKADYFALQVENGFICEELKGKILATLFYEPSTRTRLSFETAMIRLGGNVITTENAKEFSSAVKGESIEDTARIVGNYADAIVIRHYEEGTAKRAASISPVPVINAGDGKGQHPTQALLDLYTIYKEFGRTNNLKIAFVGDLASGRTVRSLCYLLGKLNSNAECVFVSPENLKMGVDIKDYLTKHGIKWVEETDLNNVLGQVDIIYMTRIQKERLSIEDYEKAKGKYIINEENLKLIKPESRIMHPLPHVEEIDLPTKFEQEDVRIAYFRQAENGLYIRMALLHNLLSRNG
jgi:aspartate carbamoyltransferase catalytic subunit